MSLIVRKVPFDISVAIRGETIERLAEDFGWSTSLHVVVVNVWAEWAETSMVYMHKKYNVFDDTEEAKTLFVQEARHATALHHINKQLLGANSHVKDPKLGRVPALAHPIMSRRFGLGEQIDGTYVDELRSFLLYCVAIEATIGLIGTAGASSMLEQMDQREVMSTYLNHAAFFYVFFYHLAEEAEHSHVSWEYYERRYGPIAEIAAEFSAAVEDVINDLKAIYVATARALGSPGGGREVDDVYSPLLAQLRARIRRFDMWAFHETRRSLPRSWDDVWEPRFRSRCESLIQT